MEKFQKYLAIILLIVVAFIAGYYVSEWKWNCCAWGEGCERSIDAQRCDDMLNINKDGQ